MKKNFIKHSSVIVAALLAQSDQFRLFFCNKKARTANIAILAFNIQNTDQAPVYARGSRPDGCLDMWYFLYFD